MSTPPNTAATSQLTLVLDRFDAAWQGDQPPRLTEFLTGSTTPAARRELLLELIPIDLEYRWRKYAARQGSSRMSAAEEEIAGLPRTPSLRHYSERLPELGPLENLPPALFAQEYRVRRQFGGWHGPADFEATYPTLFASVGPLLHEMDRNLTREPAARAADDPSRAPTFSIAQQSASLDTAANVPGPAPSGSRTIGPGFQLGEYRLLERLGKGGMGEVFKAEHRRMQRQVALKILPPERVSSPEAVQRFHREVVAIARLNHPNIVTAHDAREDHGVHYLVMEYVPGADLARIVKEQGPLTVGKAVAYMLQAARGLVYTHAHHVVHRDLKPANFLLADDGTIKILDLGLARLHIQSDVADSPEHSLTTDGDLMGTADFMAPEQALNAHKADERSDVYSLGATLYYLLTGQRMYAGDTFMERVLAHQTQPIPSLSAAVQKQSTGTDFARVIESLDAIFHKLVAKAPAERYQSMAEVVVALESLRPADLPETALIRPQIGKTTPRRSRWLEVVYGGVAVLTLAIGLYIIFRSQRPKGGSTADSELPIAGVTSTTPKVTLPPPATPAHVWPKDAPAPAIAPFNETKAKEHQEAWAKHLGVPVDFENSIGMKFRLIPPGEFMMGSTREEIEAVLKVAGNDATLEHLQSEAPRHKVTLTKPFYLGAYEVTQAQYQKVMGQNPSHFAAMGAGKAAVHGQDTANFPAENMDWNNTALFDRKLSALAPEKTAGHVYRLPTEAEWEFACRAGTTMRYSIGDNEEQLEMACWSNLNSGGRTHPVGELKANPFGLYDMHGNVWEWCGDWHSAYSGNAVDAVGPAAGDQRVLRGGSWNYIAADARAASRDGYTPAEYNNYRGFRVVLSIDAAKTPAAPPEKGPADAK